MRKVINLFILIVVTITITSTTKCYGQSKQFPPIQIFLDKINGQIFEENFFKKEFIKQSITNNSFTLICKVVSQGNIKKNIYSSIQWDKFIVVSPNSIPNADQYLECVFKFEDKINISLSSNGEVYSDKLESYYFSCFILKKDKTEFLKVVDNWVKSNKMP